MPLTISDDSFNERSNEGKYAEFQVKAVFENCNFKVDSSQAFAKRDLKVIGDAGAAAIEVKNELKYANGKNICVETFQGRTRKPSGIMTSEADVTIHFLGHDCVAYQTQPMRDWLSLQERIGTYQQCEFGKADNGNGGYIVNRDHLEVSGCEFTYKGPVADLPKCKLFSQLK